MNRYSRHELAQRTFMDEWASKIPDSRWVPAHTTAPYDVAVHRPNGSSGVRTLFVEIKTWTKTRRYQLSPAERAFGKWSEYHSTPYLVVLSRVRGNEVRGTELHRPFATNVETVDPEEVLA